jgi:hypothetical protein
MSNTRYVLLKSDSPTKYKPEPRDEEEGAMPNKQ